ncbi:hypothetical protein D9611_013469 [Ephemerocybe angulata]|uniref:DUF7918 domain-containing protein n=1 Tax=Ephemerocybe angulata TaxID=980116 RepID=A0A8H5BTG4_9AGAR|nr:hypothetical protein D9611_013469 [Tulosesus angulatus]
MSWSADPPPFDSKEFSIGLTVPSQKVQETNHSIYVYLDGANASSRGGIVFKDSLASESKTKHFCDQLVKDRTATRAFEFGSLELTDDESSLGAAAKQFGQIVVSVMAVAEYSLVPETPALSVFAEDYRIHESTKKGLVHCVKLGREKPLCGVIRRHWQPIEWKQVCRFVFKYRHIAILEADGIAPPQVKEPSASDASSLRSPVPTSSGAAPGEGRKSLGKRKATVVEEHDDKTLDEDIALLEARLSALKDRRASKRLKQESNDIVIPQQGNRKRTFVPSFAVAWNILSSS